MLRTHIRDYKERIELAKESRKETSSYVLFVIAYLQLHLFPQLIKLRLVVQVGSQNPDLLVTSPAAQSSLLHAYDSEAHLVGESCSPSLPEQA